MKLFFATILSLTMITAHAQSSSGIDPRPAPKSANSGDLSGTGATNSGAGTGMMKKTEHSDKKAKQEGNCSGLGGQAQADCLSAHKK